MILKNKEIKVEELEDKYLTKFYHFIKFIEDEIMFQFKIENKIEIDWVDKYSSELLDFEANIKILDN